MSGQDDEGERKALLESAEGSGEKIYIAGGTETYERKGKSKASAGAEDAASDGSSSSDDDEEPDLLGYNSDENDTKYDPYYWEADYVAPAAAAAAADGAAAGKALKHHASDAAGADAGTARPPTDVPLKTKVWHNAHWAGSYVLSGVEFAGEVIATFFGLNRSEYQWMLDMQERENRMKAERALENQQRREIALAARKKAEREKERKRMARLESGGGDA